MIYMLKKRFYILLFFCLLLGGNVNSSTVDKGETMLRLKTKVRKRTTCLLLIRL